MLQRFLSQLIKPTRSHIFLKLLIPDLCIKLCEPISEGREFFGGQLADSPFNFWQVTHRDNSNIGQNFPEYTASEEALIEAAQMF